MHYLLEGLNEEQQQAVIHDQGPLLILAGAGSGKTKTLTHRIAYLISEKQVAPERILAVTFTNKAAKEMRERLGLLLGQDGTNRSFMPWMGTFHSVCVRMLRYDGEHIGVPRNFTILDDADRLSLVRDAMKRLHISEKSFTPRSVLGLISSAKNELVGPDDYASVARLPLQKVVADVYPLYEAERHKAGALDFDDLIAEAARLLKSLPELRQAWRHRFQYILIDEYQDTNAAQYQLVRLLVNEHANICVVGDDWQSIYSWRGADFTNILRFERDFPGTNVIKLEQNYRSTKSILDAAHSVITKNDNRSDKKLWTAAGGGKPVQIVQVGSESQEGEAIVSRIKMAVEIGARRLNEYAVLYRTNAQSRSVEEAFIRYGVPYRVVGGVRFYDRKEIKDVMAYLRLMYQPNDRAAFLRIANVPARGIGAVSLGRFLEWQAATDMSIVDGLKAAALCPQLTGKAKTALEGLGSTLDRLAGQIDSLPLQELIELLIARINFMEFLDDGTPQAESRKENVEELLSVAQEYADLGLSGFLEEVALISDLDSMESGAEAVTLMTLHAAKGLEFPVVFMVGMEEGIFPHSRALYEPAEMEEERRLCYVGMTRAKEELHLMSAASRLLYGSTQHNPPSRFLSDIDGDAALAPAMPGFAASNLPEDDFEPHYEPEDDGGLAPGDKVRHQIFGVGTVQSLDGMTATIAFPRGVRKLNLAFAPLERA
ncbi:UvrD-helicase domain-containing protein [Candidatus Saccharibacteria bacterium]|nr:UvrD-helicase domain-containing protein [Candidatus Saccharibacteria bacterium]